MRGTVGLARRLAASCRLAALEAHALGSAGAALDGSLGHAQSGGAAACQRVAARWVTHAGYPDDPIFEPIHIQDEAFCRQRQLVPLGFREPILAPDTWIAPNAVCIGDCDLFDQVSIWYGCVLRADLNTIMVGAFTNIQDRTIIHAARTSPTGLPAHTTVGRYCTVGQACLLRSTYIHDEVIIGDRCILLEGSLVEKNAVLAPGTVLPPGRLIPGGQLWAGNPARYVRDLTKDEKADIPIIAQGMFRHVNAHMSEFLPHPEAFPEAERLRALLAVKEDDSQKEGS